MLIIAQLAQFLGVVEPFLRRLEDAQGAEIRQLRHFVRDICVASNHAAAVAFDTHNTAVLPMTGFYRYTNVLADEPGPLLTAFSSQPV